MDSDLAGFLVQKFRHSLESVRSQSSSDTTFLTFERLVNELNEVISGSPTSSELIELLYEFNDVLSGWLIHSKKQQKMSIIKNISPLFDAAHWTDIRRLQFLIHRQMLRSGSSQKSQPTFDLDRFTFYESDGPSHHIVGFQEQQDKIVGWLTAASGDDHQGFIKTVGIYGIGGSGKTTLVKQVLKHPKVAGKFGKNIIWACLSHLTSSDEVDIGIVKYMLNYLDYDVDNMRDNKQAGNEAWLMNQLKSKLVGLEKYVIVLDDLWYCSEWIAGFYSKVVKDNTAAAAAVIVTSRKREVVQELMFGKKKRDINRGAIMIHVDPWDCMDHNGNFLIHIAHQNKEPVKDGDKEQVIRHCHGLALAAQHLPQLQHLNGENRADQKDEEGSTSRYPRGNIPVHKKLLPRVFRV